MPLGFEYHGEYRFNQGVLQASLDTLLIPLSIREEAMPRESDQLVLFD